MYKFSNKSLLLLNEVHRDLRQVMLEAITDSPYDFAITEGLRSKERQQELFDKGLSKTLNSRHLTGKAVDIAVFVDGDITWNYKYYKEVAEHILVVSKLNAAPMIWGGNWKSLVDAVHFELDSKYYP